MSEGVRIKAVGDIMLGDHPVCYGHGVRSSLELFGPDYLFEQIKDTLNDCDILFGNLESVLSDKNMIARHLPSCELRGSPDCCTMLRSAGFDVLAFANNHATQHGLEAFYDTAENINSHDMFCLGLNDGGRSNVYHYKKNNVDVAIIGFSQRKDKYIGGPLPYAFGNEREMLQQIAELRRDGKTVVISLHWGDEYMHFPSIAQVSLGHKIIDAGASLLLGHHPHVLQGIERFKGGYIAYSLGNFVFDKWQKPQRETMVLDCVLSRKGVEHIETIPVLIGKRYQPLPAQGNERKVLEAKIAQFSKDITESRIDDYSTWVRRAYLKFRLQSYLYFFANIYKYKKWVIWQSFRRFISRRIAN